MPSLILAYLPPPPGTIKEWHQQKNAVLEYFTRALMAFIAIVLFFQFLRAVLFEYVSTSWSFGHRSYPYTLKKWQ